MKEVSQELQQGEWRDKKILDFGWWIEDDVEFWMVNGGLKTMLNVGLKTMLNVGFWIFDF